MSPVLAPNNVNAWTVKGEALNTSGHMVGGRSSQIAFAVHIENTWLA